MNKPRSVMSHGEVKDLKLLKMNLENRSDTKRKENT
jgi:hypothetical protein